MIPIVVPEHADHGKPFGKKRPDRKRGAVIPGVQHELHAIAQEQTRELRYRGDAVVCI
jgi:hypothetical protein